MWRYIIVMCIQTMTNEDDQCQVCTVTVNISTTLFTCFLMHALYIGER